MSDKVLTEKETRVRLMKTAKNFGFERDLQEIFDKTDKMLYGCTNEQEKKMIAIYGALEIHKLFGNVGPLAVGDQQIIQDDTETEEKKQG